MASSSTNRVRAKIFYPSPLFFVHTSKVFSWFQTRERLDVIIANLQAGHALSEEQKNFLIVYAHEVRNLLPTGIVPISSFIHSHGLPRGGIQRIQNQVNNLETSIELEELNLARLNNRRNQLMAELDSTNRNIARTQASIGRIYSSITNRNEIVDTHEQHETRMQAIQAIQDFLNLM